MKLSMHIMITQNIISFTESRDLDYCGLNKMMKSGYKWNELEKLEMVLGE